MPDVIPVKIWQKAERADTTLSQQLGDTLSGAPLIIVKKPAFCLFLIYIHITFVTSIGSNLLWGVWDTDVVVEDVGRKESARWYTLHGLCHLFLFHRPIPDFPTFYIYMEVYLRLCIRISFCSSFLVIINSSIYI